MSYTVVRDNVIWARHIEGDRDLVARILEMPENASILLLVEGTPVRFAKMRDGADGRRTPGLRPADDEAKRFWEGLQERRGDRIEVKAADAPSNAYLASLAALLSEWDSPEDAAAYDRL